MSSPIIREAFEFVTNARNSLKLKPLRTFTKKGTSISVSDISQGSVFKLKKEVMKMDKDEIYRTVSHIDKNGKATVDLIETPTAKIESLPNGIKIWLKKQGIGLLGGGNIKTAGNLLFNSGKPGSYFLTKEASQKILNAAKKSAAEVDKVLKELALA